MVLQDHFRPPLSTRRHWHSFHNAWATYIASDLNQKLPEGYFAEPNVQFGIEIDVATFEEVRQAGREDVTQGFAGVPWEPLPPNQSVPFLPTTETVEISVFNAEAGPTLMGAIELISPANKDRTAHRDAFVAKCQTYLQQGIGLVIVDVVTERNANLHCELLSRLQSTDISLHQESLYGVAYRVVEREGQPNLDIWQHSLAVGEPLPTLPLWLHGGLCLPVDLNATYDRTCREQRIIPSTV